tara:strand:- start:41 stop:490 length:450 start_codon:yes stop_codon:yes gene_type:complete
LNFLLSFNRQKILALSLIIIILFLIFFSVKFYFLNKNNIIKLDLDESNIDITEPKFSINSKSHKIYVTARQGSFVGEGKILLKKNVKFESNKFTINSDNVTFDRNKQTAHSIDKSTFKSENTTITSEGFNIYDNGDKINFYGNARLILK